MDGARGRRDRRPGEREKSREMSPSVSSCGGPPYIHARGSPNLISLTDRSHFVSRYVRGDSKRKRRFIAPRDR